MSGIYFDFSLKKYDFSRKRRPTLPFSHVITPKRRHTSGAVSIRPKYALCTLDGGGGRAEGARVHFGQKRPPLLGPSVSFCGASANFPFHAPRRGGRTGGAPCGTGEGDLPLMHSWPLQSGPFQQKWSSRNALKFMILSIKLIILSSSHRANINLFRSNLGKRSSVFRVVIK